MSRSAQVRLTRAEAIKLGEVAHALTSEEHVEVWRNLSGKAVARGFSAKAIFQLTPTEKRT